MKDFIHYKDYYGSVYFDQEGMVFHGKVEFIRALISYESTNAKGLKKAFEEAIDDYLEMCRQEKIEPEEMMTMLNKTDQSALINHEQILHYQDKMKYEIDSWDLHQALEHGKNIVVIDARSTDAYQVEHIPGAINFPHRSINVNSASESLNFDTQYITYCDGIGCNASTKGALKLAQLGYKVKELIGGIDWWKRDNYPTVSDISEMKQPYQDCGCGG